MNVPEKHKENAHAWVNGAQILGRRSAHCNWRLMKSPKWSENYEYKIQETKPSINWEHVHKDFNFLAVDKCGGAFLYSKRPNKGGDHWDITNSSIARVFSHASYTRGNCDWKDSLIERPKD